MSNLIWGNKSLYLLSRCHTEIMRFSNALLKMVAIQTQGALAGCDLTVLRSTIRTPEQQAKFVASGRSWTSDSRHLQRPSMAVDIAIIDSTGVLRGIPKTTPEDVTMYLALGNMGLKLAKSLQIPIVYGGKWRKRDLVHWELNRARYPNIG